MENWEKSVEEIVAETPAKKINQDFIYGRVLLPFLVFLLSLHLFLSLNQNKTCNVEKETAKATVVKVDDYSKLSAENQKLKAELEKVANRVVLLGAIVNENFAALPFEGRFMMLTHDWKLTHEPRHLKMCDPETAKIIKENVE